MNKEQLSIMKRNILIMGATCAAVGLMAFGCIEPDCSITDQRDTAHRKTVVNNTRLASLGPAIFANQEEDDFFYDVAPRFMSTFTRADIAQVRSIAAFEDPERMKRIVSYKSVTISVLNDDYKFVQKAAGETAKFNAAQLKLLESIPYSTDILIRSEYLEKNRETDEIEESYSTPHITIVPEKQAKYEGGKEALLAYLREASLDCMTSAKSVLLKG